MSSMDDLKTAEKHVRPVTKDQYAWSTEEFDYDISQDEFINKSLHSPFSNHFESKLWKELTKT